MKPTRLYNDLPYDVALVCCETIDITLDYYGLTHITSVNAELQKKLKRCDSLYSDSTANNLDYIEAKRDAGEILARLTKTIEVIKAVINHDTTEKN